MAEIPNMERQALKERIAEQLLQYIQDHALSVGTKLPNEYTLARQFGVSRGTIREAVLLLVSKDILCVKQGSGTYVQNLIQQQYDPLGLDTSTDRVRLALDLTDVRIMLEPEICAMAALNRTDAEAARLAQLCDSVERQIKAGVDYIRDDMRFHEYIATCSHNVVLEPLMPIINVAVIAIANITRKALLDATITTHREILNAIIAQDSQGARAAMHMHLSMNRIVIRGAGKDHAEENL